MLYASLMKQFTQSLDSGHVSDMIVSFALRHGSLQRHLEQARVVQALTQEAGVAACVLDYL